ncbi:hypothetical protein [Actinoplanes derwentensis]|uniref:hypothetical protein n=1 Tax=Actinoplanes derwentensis TaxID=113562 RepID=UPI000B84241F|nr:hypothetical protein [Actinoplanes derwentensis]GID85247.1 hypothetical protein Ade03nite_41710 [Actinoplanes derwentensis]
MPDAERQDPIRMVSYDTAWKPDFERERVRVENLRSCPEAAADYGRIKTAPAAEDDTDRRRCRAAKAPFIRAVLDRLQSGGSSDSR